MLGKTHALGKWKTANSWQVVCNQSNARFTNEPAATENNEDIPGINKRSEARRVSPPIHRPPSTCHGVWRTVPTSRKGREKWGTQIEPKS
jgi:hypothetical protein